MLKAPFVRATFNVQINPSVFFVALGFLKPAFLLLGKSGGHARARQQQDAERSAKKSRMKLHSSSMTKDFALHGSRNHSCSRKLVTPKAALLICHPHKRDDTLSSAIMDVKPRALSRNYPPVPQAVA